MCTASPANSKLSYRMTTLHEETFRKNPPLKEENEDSYSDPEYDYDTKPSTYGGDTYAKSLMKPSHTIDSFMDLGRSSAAANSSKLLNYKMLTQNHPLQLSSSSPVTKSKTESANNNIAGSSPSTNSSTSSGFGSQTMSISNLTNLDNLSLQSMSVDETPSKFRHLSRYYSSKKYESL